jgi:hypothetical protein
MALLAGLACLLGFPSGARAGVTIDVVFQDATSPSGITINAGDWGVGCAFGGYYGGFIETAYCMDVVLKTTDPVIAVAADVAYDSDNGLEVVSFSEWRGAGVGPDVKCGPGSKCGPVIRCTPNDGVSDDGSLIGSFDCILPEPNGPPSLAPGTYTLGTIIWDTSGTTVGSEVIAAVYPVVSAAINGNVVDVSASVVLGSHIMKIIPEPGTAALLGVGVVGLVLTARRRRSRTR